MPTDDNAPRKRRLTPTFVFLNIIAACGRSPWIAVFGPINTFIDLSTPATCSPDS